MPEPVAVLPLEDCLVVDLSSGIPGAYCSRLLSDGGADVIKVESPAGDPLRRWSASGAAIGDEDGALFQYLAGAKRSAVVDTGSDGGVHLLERFLAAADTIVWSPGSAVADDPAFVPAALRERAPVATVVPITPVGLGGPWAERSHTEFTLQAWSGSAGVRGTPDRPPVTIGGRTGEWTAGMFGAIAALASRLRLSRTGIGELVDVSMLEAMVITHSSYPVRTSRLLWRTERFLNFPSIEQTKDGMVGFTVGTPDRWVAFCLMIEREDWLEDPELTDFTARYARFAELRPMAASWLTRHTTAEVVEAAEKLRLPVAEIGNGETLPAFAQVKARQWFSPNPRGAFLQPSVPYLLGGGARTRPAAAAPRLGEDTEALRAAPPEPLPRAKGSAPTAPMPLEGLRVADFTSNWAGPFLTHQLALFGADVIRVESIQRLDAVRRAGPRTGDRWSESCGFSALNTNRRSVTLDMSDRRGQDLARELCARSDVVVDNCSPHVMEGWGLGWEALSARKPDLIQVRMPGFGLAGPWRDRVAWAMTAEQLSGLAWLTGYPDQMPQVPSGLCDPVGGGHGLIGLLLALEHRRPTGRGICIDMPLVAGAVTISSEQVIEFSAYGKVLEREGNRSPLAAP